MAAGKYHGKKILAHARNIHMFANFKPVKFWSSKNLTFACRCCKSLVQVLGPVLISFRMSLSKWNKYCTAQGV